MEFNQYDWHDAIVKFIDIDRNKPGVNDKITFAIEWRNGEKSALIFEDVYWASMSLNFGIVANETILKAESFDKNDADLVRFYTDWKGLLDKVNLAKYLIEFNSTGSIIKIIARKYTIENSQ